jgi:uncharacterized phiE125 gp8 family phage protein
MYKVTTQPQFEPITLNEAKDWLKVHPDVVDDDNLIRSLIASARSWAEKGTGQALVTQTIEQVWDWMPRNRVFDLSILPVASVTSVKYLDGNGAYQTWDASNYTTDLFSNRVCVKASVSDPATSALNERPNVWKITYTAGNATALAIDANIKTAMLLQIAMMYENREDIPINKVNSNPLARSAYNLLAISRVNLI